MLSNRKSLPERERKPVPLYQEVAFFSLRMHHPFFLSGTPGSFCKFKFSFFFSIQILFIYLSIPYRETRVTKSNVCVCMCEVILRSMQSPAHGCEANVPISSQQCMYLCWLCVHPCWVLSLSVLSEMSEAELAWEWKLSSWVWERKREKAFKGADHIGVHVTWPDPNARCIFTRYKIKKLRPSWKHTARDFSVQSVSRNDFFYRRLTNFVSGWSESWILFLEFFGGGD